MCNNLVCEVCGGQGVHQRHFNPYHVTLCNDHFNELHTLYQDKKRRKAFIKFHIDGREGQGYGVGKKELNAWIDAEHELFLMVEKTVKGMKKEWKKKHKKKTPIRGG